MSKISDLNYSQHITLADNFKQKSEVLNTWRFWQRYLPWVMWILANAPTKRVEI